MTLLSPFFVSKIDENWSKRIHYHHQKYQVDTQPEPNTSYRRIMTFRNLSKIFSLKKTNLIFLYTFSLLLFLSFSFVDAHSSWRERVVYRSHSTELSKTFSVNIIFPFSQYWKKEKKWFGTIFLLLKKFRKGKGTVHWMWVTISVDPYRIWNLANITIMFHFNEKFFHPETFDSW